MRPQTAFLLVAALAGLALGVWYARRPLRPALYVHPLDYPGAGMGGFAYGSPQVPGPSSTSLFQQSGLVYQ